MKLKSLMTSAAILSMLATSAAYAAGPTEVVVEDDPFVVAEAGSSADPATIAAIAGGVALVALIASSGGDSSDGTDGTDGTTGTAD